MNSERGTSVSAVGSAKANEDLGNTRSRSANGAVVTYQPGQRREWLNITPQIEECFRASGIREGLCRVNAMHVTASVGSYEIKEVDSDYFSEE